MSTDVRSLLRLVILNPRFITAKHHGRQLITKARRDRRPTRAETPRVPTPYGALCADIPEFTGPKHTEDLLGASAI
jgi:hypothetical protein